MTVRIERLDAACSCGCGTTAHAGPDGACVQCGTCLGWTRPEAEQAALIDRELSEIVDFDGRAATVDTELSADLLSMLVQVEDEFERSHGWDYQPALYIIKGALTPLGQVGIMRLEPVALPPEAWMLHDSQHIFIEELARGARSPDIRSALLGPAPARFLGVALIGEGWVRVPGGDLRRTARDNPELRQDECRFVYGVDVDDRQYNVMRFRNRGDVVSEVVTSQRWSQDLHASDMPEAKIVRETSPGGWPPMPRALRKLVRALSAGAP